MSIAQFHPIVQEWFRGRFSAPTDAQAEGWAAIAEGRHTLVAAPTGSGKTLAAFLTCIDGLVRAGLDGEMPERTEVVYVSPLKALSNDIERNLSGPLAEVRAIAEEWGTPLPEIRVVVRTGDTPARVRQAMTKQPPHILITTPESLFILLTSESGRRALRGTRTLIIDEIHAVVGNKRGSHLSLSMERLSALADGPVTRIGLSATQRPIEDVASFLVGAAGIDDGSSGDGPSSGEQKPPCQIVDTGHARDMDLALEMLDEELGPIATHELWAKALDRIAELVSAHTSTLVFVNTRRLVERVSHQLSLRLGEEAVVAHHGSLSRERRHAAEQRLKAGAAKVCVATASLELGIDVGAVDFVCQIGSPRSIGLLLQRVGRSGHSLGGTPKGRLFPLTRDELMECIALVRGVAHGNLDRLIIPPWPLDVMAQQIVAACAAEEWDEDALFELCRGAYPYRDLPRERYDQVVETLSYGVAPREGRRSAFLHRDGVHRTLVGRRGARLAALTSGGAIPDNADYDVIAEPEGMFVGSVNEDFAIESMAGDVFLLGNTPWRIRRVESGRVRVEDAQGSTPTVPFWLGEAPGRTPELSDEVSQLREELARGVGSRAGLESLKAVPGVPALAAEQAVAYVAEGLRILDAVPTKQRVIAERFFDESGGLQLVIHAPFGSRINKAWGMALRKEICRAFDFELQAQATDDGICLSLGPGMSFPVADVFRHIKGSTAEQVLTQAVLQAPLFALRFRWDASRALALLRFTGGRRVPPPIQRMRADDLRAAVFPEQVACQDNAPPGDLDVPDHPLVFETMRDCLTEAMDVEGLRQVLAGIERGEIEVFGRDTVQPSVFAHQILNAMPYAFLDDAPLEERRARAVTLRRALPDDARDLGSLDPDALERASRDAWPAARDARELHDALLTLGMLPEADLTDDALPHAELVRGWSPWLQELVRSGLAVRASYGTERTAWVATEFAPTFAAAFPDARFEPPPTAVPHQGEPPTEEVALIALVRGRVESSGPFTLRGMGQTLGIRPTGVELAVAHLENSGGVLRGQFTPGVEEEYCDRRILARVHRDIIGRLRREVEPVTTATFLRFLFRWQHAEPALRLTGEGGLLDVIDQIQGFEAPAAAWESELLPARLAEYRPSALDQMCFSGEVVWGRFARRLHDAPVNGARAPLSRSGPLSLGLREDLSWLLDEPTQDAPELSGLAGELLTYLSERGASFLPDLVSGTRRLPTEVENALWQLVALGRVTADGFGVLRGLVSSSTKRAQRQTRFRRGPRQRSSASRWSLLQAPAPPPEDAVEARAAQLLRRYGIVFPDLLAREPLMPSWRVLLQVYRRAEARGEIRGGRFVSGFMGEQFALPEAIEALRATRKTTPSGQMVVVSACDPLNLVGILTPGPRVPAVPGNQVAFRDGVPLASRQAGEVQCSPSLDDAGQTEALALLERDRGVPRRRPAAATAAPR